jgi:hypothetical protein
MIDSPRSAYGMSPLEIYGRRLFDEPPLSDAFCLDIQDVILWCEKRSNRVRNDYATQGNDVAVYRKFQQAIIDADAKIFNLLRTQFMVSFFERQTSRPVVKDFGCDRLRELIPMDGGNDYFQKLPVAWRAALNGFGPWFAAFLHDSNMFYLSKDSPAGNMRELAVMPLDADVGKIIARHSATVGLIRPPVPKHTAEYKESSAHMLERYQTFGQ